MVFPKAHIKQKSSFKVPDFIQTVSGEIETTELGLGAMKLLETNKLPLKIGNLTQEEK